MDDRTTAAPYASPSPSSQRTSSGVPTTIFSVFFFSGTAMRSSQTSSHSSSDAR